MFLDFRARHAVKNPTKKISWKYDLKKDYPSPNINFKIKYLSRYLSTLSSPYSDIFSA